jgi:hypothetical protein
VITKYSGETPINYTVIDLVNQTINTQNLQKGQLYRVSNYTNTTHIDYLGISSILPWSQPKNEIFLNHFKILKELHSQL